MAEVLEAPPHASEHNDGSDPSAKLSTWERFSFSTMRRLLGAHAAVWGLRGLERSCRAFGTMEYLVNYKRRRRVRDMLETIYNGTPTRVTSSMIRRHFMRQRCDKALYLGFCDLTTEQILDRFSIVNRHVLDEGLARGRGVYGFLSHHGPHHVTGMLLSAMGYRVGGVRDPKEGRVRRYAQELWQRNHPELPRTRILYSGSFVRPIFRLLSQNYALGSSPDITRLRDPHQRTVEVRVFNQTRHFLTGPLRIALRCRSTIIQAFMIAEKDFRYRLEILGPMVDPDVGDESDELVTRVMQQYADNATEYARRYPDHVMRV